METAATVRTFLGFDVADRACAVEARFVEEIQPFAALTRPPGLPPLVEGFLIVEGQAVPVVCLARLFGLDDHPPGMFTPLLILRCGALPTAIRVAGVTRMTRVPPDATLPLPDDHVFRGCATESFSVDGRVVCVLSPDRLLLEAENQRLIELRAIEQKRLLELEGAAA